MLALASPVCEVHAHGSDAVQVIFHALPDMGGVAGSAAHTVWTAQNKAGSHDQCVLPLPIQLASIWLISLSQGAEKEQPAAMHMAGRPSSAAPPQMPVAFSVR